jgi:two-component SAPR family response regulator
VKGFAAQSLPDRLIGAMCALAELQLRTGDIASAETLLLFLKHEYDKRPDDDGEAAGRLSRALAAGARLIDSEASAKSWYIEAIGQFERKGRLAEAASTLARLIVQCGDAIQEHEWKDLAWRLRQWSAAADDVRDLYPWIGSLWDLRQGYWEPSIVSLRKFLNESSAGQLPYYHIAEIQIVVYRAMPELNVEEALRSGDALRALQQKHCADYLLQYRLLQALADGLRRAGQTLEAEEAAAELDRLARHLKLPRPSVREVSSPVPVGPFRANAEEEGAVWRIRLFGGLAFQNGFREVRGMRWKRKKAQELCVYLLLQPNYMSSRDQLIDILQLGEVHDKAARLLHVITHQLRQTFLDELGIRDIVFIREGLVSLRENAIEYVDVEKYYALIRTADQLWIKDRPLACELYEEAHALYDELLPELPYISWLANVREHALDKQTSIVRKLCRAAEEKQDAIMEEHYCREWLRLRPDQEEACQQQLRILTRTKRHQEARQLYERFARHYREELGLEPSAETAQLLEERRS